MSEEITAEAVEEMTEEVETKSKKVLGKVTSAATKVGGAYKFAFFTCLGTALTVEEKLVAFSKKMADKGATVKMGSPTTMITQKLDAPKAKLVTTKESFKVKAHDKITDVEEALDKGVNKSLHFIGVPSRKDMDQMTLLMKDMADSISELSTQLQEQKTTTRSTAKKSTSTKSGDSQTSAA